MALPSSGEEHMLSRAYFTNRLPTTASVVTCPWSSGPRDPSAIVSHALKQVRVETYIVCSGYVLQRIRLMNASLEVILCHHLEQFVRIAFIFLPGEDVVE